MATTIDAAGRLVIPKAIRESGGLRPGTRVRFRVESDGVVVEPQPLEVTFERRGSMIVAVSRKPAPPLSSEEVIHVIDRIRDRYTDTESDS